MGSGASSQPAKGGVYVASTSAIKPRSANIKPRSQPSKPKPKSKSEPKPKPKPKSKSEPKPKQKQKQTRASDFATLLVVKEPSYLRGLAIGTSWKSEIKKATKESGGFTGHGCGLALFSANSKSKPMTFLFEPAGWKDNVVLRRQDDRKCTLDIAYRKYDLGSSITTWCIDNHPDWTIKYNTTNGKICVAEKGKGHLCLGYSTKDKNRSSPIVLVDKNDKNALIFYKKPQEAKKHYEATKSKASLYMIKSPSNYLGRYIVPSWSWSKSGTKKKTTVIETGLRLGRRDSCRKPVEILEDGTLGSYSRILRNGTNESMTILGNKIRQEIDVIFYDNSDDWRCKSGVYVSDWKYIHDDQGIKLALRGNKSHCLGIRGNLYDESGSEQNEETFGRACQLWLQDQGVWTFVSQDQNVASKAIKMVNDIISRNNNVKSIKLRDDDPDNIEAMVKADGVLGSKEFLKAYTSTTLCLVDSKDSRCITFLKGHEKEDYIHKQNAKDAKAHMKDTSQEVHVFQNDKNKNRVNRDDAKLEVCKAGLEWDDAFEEFFEDALRESDNTVNRSQLTRKIERKKQKMKKASEEKMDEKARMHEMGENILMKVLKRDDVKQLQSLPKEWREALVPKESKDGMKLFEKMNDIDRRCHAYLSNSNNSGRIPDDLYNEFDNILRTECKNMFSSRIQMYEKCLKDESSNAYREIVNLLNHLEKLYHTSYNGAFETQISMGDDEGLKAWQDFVRDVAQPRGLLSGKTMHQSATELTLILEHAMKILTRYQDVMRKIASETGGIFNAAPLKRSYRAFEKAAMRPDVKNRFVCDNVYDVVRGALVYEDMAGAVRGAKALCECKDIVLERMKDRFSPGHESSGGWRDAMFNGYLKSDRAHHRFEVQIHHKSLLFVRQNLGGHYIYAKFRALNEALEVVGKK